MSEQIYQWTDQPAINVNESMMYLKQEQDAQRVNLETKANTNLDNITDTGKMASIGWGMPDYENGEAKSLDVEHVALCDGVAYAVARNGESRGEARISISIIKDGKELLHVSNYGGSYQSGTYKFATAYVLIPKGYSYKFLNLVGSLEKCMFYPMKGCAPQ